MTSLNSFAAHFLISLSLSLDTTTINSGLYRGQWNLIEWGGNNIRSSPRAHERCLVKCVKDLHRFYPKNAWKIFLKRWQASVENCINLFSSIYSFISCNKNARSERNHVRLLKEEEENFFLLKRDIVSVEYFIARASKAISWTYRER